MTMVTVEQAQAHLPELIEQAQRGEEVIITQRDQPAIKLAVAGEAQGQQPSEATPPEAKGWPFFGILKGQVTMSPDFDEPLEEFRPYM